MVLINRAFFPPFLLQEGPGSLWTAPTMLGPVELAAQTLESTVTVGTTCVVTPKASSLPLPSLDEALPASWLSVCVSLPLHAVGMTWTRHLGSYRRVLRPFYR
ncbi:Hypothetical predicted protein [Marmota monax]|uniref:Uncharacterized protein n=1 Tax=Marmota monax TaxID=9995 RepID=A0A5E4BKA5_MARMO|nr:hypothetical protein GHT09_001219 [Marmota monax]VTJ69369.1 Hypothetical predicted protein [Marmota monax]